MRKLLFAFIACISFFSLQAQMTQDSIYIIAEKPARFPGCDDSTLSGPALDSCGQAKLFEFVYQHIRYPEEARRNGNQGTAVISFVVEKDGTTSNETISKDIPGGCGVEALRVVKSMNPSGIKWKPGLVSGKIVRTKLNLPVKFKLEDEVNFSIYEGDTVYTQVDSIVSFIGGAEGLQAYMKKTLKYPQHYRDSCLTGAMDLNLVIFADGRVKVFDLIDYSQLGIDFEYEAIAYALSTARKWRPAMYKGNQVNGTSPLRVVFKPTSGKCAEVNAKYDVAYHIMEEGMNLYDAGKNDEGIAKLSQSIEMFPRNMEFLYTRGMMYLNMNKFGESCTDLSQVKKNMIITWFENLLPLICSRANSAPPIPEK